MKKTDYVRKLVAYVLKEYPLWYASIALTFISVASEVLGVASLYPLSILATGHSINPDLFIVKQLIRVGVAPSLKSLLVVFLGLFAFRIVTNLLNQSLYLFLGRETYAHLSHESFRAILKKETIRSIEEKSAGHFIGLSGDESFRASTIVVTLIQILNSFVLSSLYFVAIVNFSVSIAWSLIGFLVLNAAILVPVFRKTHKFGVRQVELNRSSNTLFLDALNGLRSVRAFSGEEFTARGYRDLIYRYARTLFLIEFIPLIAKSAPALLLIGLSMVVVVTASASTWTSIDVAFVITLIAFTTRFLPSVGNTVTTFMKLLSDARAGKDVTYLVQAAREIGPSRLSGIPGSVDSIRIKTLRFAYGDKVDVIRDLQVNFNRGKSYAIVGESGSGKSTLLDLMLKFYAFEEGDISVNENSIKEIDESILRKKVLLIGQQTTILNDTVRNNISYGLEMTEETIRKAAALAQIDEAIERLPNRYDTLLNYQGSNLSGGQRQRIGLARALSRAPDVLILDEITSALDSETRDLVVENILREFRDKIVIFVTHDDFVKKKVSEVISIARPKPHP